MTDVEERAQEQLLELLYLCPTAIVKFEPGGAIAMMNPLAAQVLVPLATGAIVENLFDIFAASAPELREMVNRFKGRTGRVCDEHRVLAAVGSGVDTRALVLSITMQKVDDDVFVAVIADVTTGAIREQLLRTNEARLHAAFDSVRDYSICTVDPQGKIASWNRSAERLDGYRADEVIGVSADLLVATSGVERSSFGPSYALARAEGFHEFEGWRVRRDGTRYWASVAISVLRENNDDDSIIGYSIVTRDITERRRSEDLLHEMVVTDPLTGALNRRGLFDAAVREDVGRRVAGAPMALLMLDVDHFKEINDQHGHSAGDAVLKQVVARARTEIRAMDVIGRYGGEEFAILLPGSDAAAATVVAERIRERMVQSPMVFIGGTATVSVSIGVAQTTAQVDDVANLVRVADAALYAAKRQGRNRVSVA